jgi:type IV secretion system protein VirB11
MRCVTPTEGLTPQVTIQTAANDGRDTSSLDHFLKPLAVWLRDPSITEICINQPQQIFIERPIGWTQEPLTEATFDWCLHLAHLVANATRQRISAQTPILSGTLPGGERIQIVIPPATDTDRVSITLRKPTAGLKTVGQLTEQGLFQRCQIASESLDPTEAELLALLRERSFENFMKLAVKTRKNIVVSGPTGSGKTTFTKGLILEIPEDERLITIEDAKELVLDHHPNHVRLYYSKDGQGQAHVTPKQLLESCLRMRPDRILLAELRNINSGHPGSITSVHASSAKLAFEQLMLLVKESPGGRELAREDIKNLLYLLVDVVIQFGIDHQQRFVKEIWYDPTTKRNAS